MALLARGVASTLSTAPRVVFYDLETSIVARAVPSPRDGAAPRSHGRRNLIVEIGSVLDCGTTFQRLVDPRYAGLTLAQTFEQSGQNPERTLRFWNRLFREKGMVQKATRGGGGRKPLSARLADYDRLFDGDGFVSARSALTHFMHFAYRGCARPPLFVAHNGASFDHNILRAYTRRLNLPAFTNMHDSLKPARQALPHMKSHSLGALHKKLVGEPFQAHHALSDAQALARVCRSLAVREAVPLHCLWSHMYGSLTSLRGVGPKTARALRQAGHTLPTLRQTVLQHRLCPPELRSCIRNHKALWRQLRKKWSASAHRAAAAAPTPPQTPRCAPSMRARTTVPSAAPKLRGSAPSATAEAPLWPTTWIRRGRRLAFARKRSARSKSV